MKKLVFLVVMLLLLVSCSKNTSDGYLISSNDNNLFELILYVEDNSYTKFDVYATIEYVGNDDAITVYSGEELLEFRIKSQDGIDISSSESIEFKEKLLSKGVKYKVDISDVEFKDKEYFKAKDGKSKVNLDLPSGLYIIEVHTDFGLVDVDNNYVQSTSLEHIID